jgi:hypothetical protein
MDDKIILICATGRSGSTTMQRILNTITNSNICGENLGAINSLLEFYRRIKTTTFKHVPGSLVPLNLDDILSQNIKPAWYNSYNFQQTVSMIKVLIISLLKKNESNNVWGFKEIRYDNGDINYMKDFKELFPQTKIIIHIRENIKSQSESGWFKTDKSAITYLYNLNKDLYNFYANNTDYCYFTTFEKMFDVNNIKKIFEFIDCAESYNENNIKLILNNNIKD